MHMSAHQGVSAVNGGCVRLGSMPYPGGHSIAVQQQVPFYEHSIMTARVATVMEVGVIYCCFNTPCECNIYIALDRACTCRPTKACAVSGGCVRLGSKPYPGGHSAAEQQQQQFDDHNIMTAYWQLLLAWL
jgi:hypothetical protein